MDEKTTWQPHVTVATVIEKDGRYLMVEEFSSGKRVYNQPAGHLEPDETMQEAAVRETLEETGWHVSLTGVLGMALYTAPSNGVTYYRTTFIAKADQQQANAELDKDIIAAHWLTLTEIRELHQQGLLRSPLVLETLEHYERSEGYSLDLFYS